MPFIVIMQTYIKNINEYNRLVKALTFTTVFVILTIGAMFIHTHTHVVYSYHLLLTHIVHVCVFMS